MRMHRVFSPDTLIEFEHEKIHKREHIFMLISSYLFLDFMLRGIQFFCLLSGYVFEPKNIFDLSKFKHEFIFIVFFVILVYTKRWVIRWIR